MSKSQTHLKLYFLQYNPSKKPYQQYFKGILWSIFAAASLSYEVMCFEIISQKRRYVVLHESHSLFFALVLY